MFVLKLFGANIFSLEVDDLDNLLRRINRFILIKDHKTLKYEVKSLRQIIDELPKESRYLVKLIK